MISVEGVHKIYKTQFGSNHVLDNVSFTLQKGEKLGIIGRNGAGKSTLVRLVSGAEMPTSGKITRDMSVSWPLAFGGAFQLNLTGKDNVRFISRIYKQDFEYNLAFVEEFAELGPYLQEPVRSYSSGMRARLAFAISMITEFDCFLIDEVGAVGDARFHEKCNYELFQKRADRAMIIISHDAAYIRDHCSRYAILHDSRFTPYDDFDVAYSDYADMIAITKVPVSKNSNTSSQTSGLDVSYRAATEDERFRVFVQRGDWARDKSDWVLAESEYSAALELHPYERTYWAQHGHVVRAQKKYISAEISYRNACALGMPTLDVRPFLRDVMLHQSTNEQEYPIHASGKGGVSSRPPSSQHIKVFAEAFLGINSLSEFEILELMRRYSNMDDLVQFMLMNKNKYTASKAPENNDNISSARKISEEDSRWIIELCQISGSKLECFSSEEVLAQFEKFDDVIPTIVSAGGFHDWEKVKSALAA